MSEQEKETLEELKEQYQINKQNERYFIQVFLALKKCDDEAILSQLLKIINYFTDKEPGDCQIPELINADTIDWLLDIMQTYEHNKYLSCLSSLTLLSIVDKHTVVINHQENSIVKKFHKVLRSIEKMTRAPQDDEDGLDQDEQEELSGGRDSEGEQDARKLRPQDQ